MKDILTLSAQINTNNFVSINKDKDFRLQNVKSIVVKKFNPTASIIKEQGGLI